MTTREALSILKPKARTEEAIKAAYREACLQHHPDHGGDIELMKLVNLAMECLNSRPWTAYEARAAANDMPLTEILKTAWDQIKHLPEINGEVCGSWIWVTGTTKKYRHELKAAGFRFSRNKIAWYFHGPGYRKRTKRSFNIDEIRSQWGSNDLKTETAQAIG